eukprot:2083256-Prymnesium_polylepis.1
MAAGGHRPRQLARPGDAGGAEAAAPQRRHRRGRAPVAAGARLNWGWPRVATCRIREAECEWLQVVRRWHSSFVHHRVSSASLSPLRLTPTHTHSHCRASHPLCARALSRRDFASYRRTTAAPPPQEVEQWKRYKAS